MGDSFATLEPGLRAYFSAVPSADRGVGEGAFERIGTPRKWLWPFLWIAGLLGIVWPRWETDVAFRVENRESGDTRRSLRTFGFGAGPRTMIDVTSWHDGRLIDRLGRGGLLRIELRPGSEAGRLVIRSGRARFLGIPFPGRITIRESTVDGRHHVDFLMDAPLIGRVYEYAGTFTWYRIESE